MLTLYKVRHPLGIQQRPHQGGRRMESSLHDQRRLIRTHGYVLRSHKFTSHIPNNDELSLAPEIAEQWLTIYMDDMAIHTAKLPDETEEQHLQRHCKLVKRILAKLQEHNLFLKPEKCTFEQPTIEFLGVNVDQGTVQMDDTKIVKVKNWITPHNVREVRKFLGF